MAAKPQAASTIDRDATTLIKVPTVKPAPPVVASQAADSPSAPPVDTSRADPTLLLPGVRPKNDKRALVIGVVAALLVLLVVGLLIRPSGDIAPTTATSTPKAVAAPDTTPASKPATPATVAPATAADGSDAAQPAPSQPAGSTRPRAADSPPARNKTAPASKPPPSATPAPAGAKTRPGFDPSKPWEED